jgi:hypothetical protein
MGIALREPVIAEPLTRRSALAHLDAAFEHRPVLSGDDLVSALARDGAPRELVDLMRRSVSPTARFAGTEPLRRHLRKLPRG